MEDPERDEPEAAAEDTDDLDLEAEETEDVKGGTWGSGGFAAPPPPPKPI